MFDLEGKIAVVTGAASGIGLAVSRRFAAAGATVYMADIADVDDGKLIADEILGHYIQTDVGDEEQVRALMAHAAEAKGEIDICVNNAGTTGGGALLVDEQRSNMERVFRVNTLGVLYGIKHAAPYMPHGSAIVNTASILGVIGYPRCGAYTASKFAVVGMTKVAALELGEQGIRVNCVCPSTVNTPWLTKQTNGEMEIAAFGINVRFPQTCRA